MNKAARFSIFLSIFLFGGKLAHAAPANDVVEPLADMLECAKITEDIGRLACFDAVVKNTQTTVKAKIIKNKVEKEQEEIANFGKGQLRASPVKEIREKQRKIEDKALKKITLKVRKFTYTASNRFVLFMENGQVWKQKDSGRIRLPKGEFSVMIKKGLIGGYNMIVPTKKQLIKVERLK